MNLPHSKMKEALVRYNVGIKVGEDNTIKVYPSANPVGQWVHYKVAEKLTQERDYWMKTAKLLMKEE
jgi:hypothetical protein